MEIALIHPQQLFANHPALAKGRPCYLIEDPLIFGNDTRWSLGGTQGHGTSGVPH
jgi:deoxyribodipyrimidine photolyase-related protein